jgi:hypothetical protein
MPSVRILASCVCCWKKLKARLQDALYVDVALDEREDCIDIGVRSAGPIMDEFAIERFIQRLAEDIRVHASFDGQA